MTTKCIFENHNRIFGRLILAAVTLYARTLTKKMKEFGLETAYGVTSKLTILCPTALVSLTAAH